MNFNTLDKLNSTKLVYVINTLTELDEIDWLHIKTSIPIDVYIEQLPLFGKYFKHNNIEEALKYSETIIESFIRDKRPNLLIVHSKGITTITNLIFKNIWKGPIVLLSPIPNNCNHLSLSALNNYDDNDDDEWDIQWRSVIKILEENEGRISIGFGNTTDEKMFVEDYVTEAAKRNGWFLKKVKGDHDWLQDPDNWNSIGELIDFAIN